MARSKKTPRLRLAYDRESGPKLPVPDLLHPEARPGLDGGALDELLEISFLGGDRSGNLERALDTPLSERSSWDPNLFQEELFFDDLVESCFQLEVKGTRIPVNKAYLRQILSHPPTDLETVRFRQEILRELDNRPDVAAKAQALFDELFHLLSLFKAPHKRAKLDITVFRLEILEQAQKLFELMDRDFAAASSGLRRLHEAAVAIKASEDYRILTALLDYENHLARLGFEIQVGADGKIRSLELKELIENTGSPFYQRPWKRLKDRIELLRRGYDFTGRELVNRVVHEVFLRVSDWLKPLLELLGQFSFYLGSIAFRRRALAAGLEMSLADLEIGNRLSLQSVFNPLLLRQGTPVACDLEAVAPDSILVVTGPNSGGKTRLLQAVGIAQALGQSGLYTTAARAQLPLVDGLFASTTERASVDQKEGRLGTELLRIRRLFETIDDRSLVIIDELCSGTNPSEAEEIFLWVLRLLHRTRPLAVITTHFLDFARDLQTKRPVDSLQFLQVEMKGEESTYQFVGGVAETSLATSTAERLGVTFDELSRLLETKAPAGSDLRRRTGAGSGK